MNLLATEQLRALRYASPNCIRSRPLDRDDIALLEYVIDKPLPAEYAEFLLSHPSGPVRFKEKGVFCHQQDGSRIWISSFYSITEGNDCPGRDLQERFKALSLIPRHLLPIGDNAAGDYVCIAIAGDRRGAIFYWRRADHDFLRNRPSDEPWERAISALAPSFSAFLESLEIGPAGN
jgi:hypothetical protein